MSDSIKDPRGFLIGGMIPCSLIDYPGEIAAVLFTQGCNFRCSYCHNPSLVLREKFTKPLPFTSFLSFLDRRKGKLTGVVITGGEPTLQKDLEPAIRQIKEKGFLVKLDTNGSRPDVLKSLIKEKLIDFIAMDIKAPFSQYNRVSGFKGNINSIRKSMALIQNSSLPYEFRTTVVRRFLSFPDILSIVKEMKGKGRYVLQQFRPQETLDPKLSQDTAYSYEELLTWKKDLDPLCETCLIR